MAMEAVAQSAPDFPTTRAVGAFASAAQTLARAGLAVLPLEGDDGKVPRVKWRPWKYPPSPDFIRKLIEKFPDANIGVICALSGVTVVDIDDADLLPLMIERFGETPLRTYTPRGGMHLWYRSSGERCRNLRKSEGLAVDIKGIGGFVVVPPSVRFDGEYAGCAYGFLAGSWDELKRLPTIPPGAQLLDRAQGRDGDRSNPHAAHVTPNAITLLRAVKDGYRNDMLFCSLLRHAKSCDSIDALLDAAETINADFDPPLTAAEVAKTAVSAWGYETRGQNWVGKEPRVYTLRSEWHSLASHPNGGDGMLLLQHLRFSHWDRKAFAISPKAMAQEESIPGWKNHKRYARARRAIVDMGCLKEVYRGGRRGNDPSLFALTKSAAKRGPVSGPNITSTPPPSLPSPPASQDRVEQKASGGRR